MYLVGTVVANVAVGAQAIVIAKSLDPSAYGLWGILMVVLGYNLHAHLGLIHGLNKEMPYLRGRGDFREAETIRDSTFWTVCATSLLVTSSFLIGSLLMQDRFAPDMLGITRIFSITTFFHQLYVFLISLLRTDKRFGLLSLATALHPVLSLIFVVLFMNISARTLNELVLALFLSYLIIDVFVLWRARYRFSPVIAFTLVIRCLRVGFPLIIIAIGFSLFVSIDRWIIARMLDLESLGQYGLGATMGSFLFSICAVAAQVLYPLMLERFGSTRNARQSEDFVYLPTLAVASLGALLVAIVALLFPLLVRYILPAYVPGIGASLIIAMGFYFLGVGTVGGNLLISIDNESKILQLQAVGVLVSLVLNYTAIRMGFGIIGVALATSVAYFLYGMGMTFFSLRSVSAGIQHAFTRMARIWLPSAIAFPVVGIMLRLSGSPQSGFWSEMQVVTLQMLVLVLAALIFILPLGRSSGIYPALHRFFVRRGLLS